WLNLVAMLKPSSSSPGPKSSVAMSTSPRKIVPLKSASLAFRSGKVLRLSRTLLPRTCACANPATTIWRRKGECLDRPTLALEWCLLPAVALSKDEKRLFNLLPVSPLQAARTLHHRAKFARGVILGLFEGRLIVQCQLIGD